MDDAAIRAAAIEKRRKRIEIGGELNVPKLSAYVRLERNAWAARERKKAKAAEAKAGGETMPPDVEEAVARAGCTQDARRKRQRRRERGCAPGSHLETPRDPLVTPRDPPRPPETP